jgi:hypothetical protein
LLQIEWTQREIPWAGIAAALAGTGSLLTGIAALKSAKSEGRKEGGREPKAVKDDSVTGN